MFKKLVKDIAISILLSVPISGSVISVNGQNTIIIPPLFEYPEAPDSLITLESRSEYVISHFWEGMDFKNKSAVDQNALNDAFQVFAIPMQWASPEISEKALSDIISKTASNPVLALQFTKAAEESFYGPRAPFWNDKGYLSFLNSILKNKKIKEERKARFRHHYNVLKNTVVGTTPPPFEYINSEGEKCRFTPDGVFTIVEFGYPDCADCRHAKLKIETDIQMENLIKQGKVNILYIVPEGDREWLTDLTAYPKEWHCGISDEISDLYDIRTTPCFYVIDQSGKVAKKNITADQVIEFTRNAFQ